MMSEAVDMLPTNLTTVAPSPAPTVTPATPLGAFRALSEL